MQRLKEEKQQQVVQHKSSRSPLPRRVAGKFYVERVCDDVFFHLRADSSARGLYIHDPKLICNKSAQRPEEIQNKSHGLACSPLCSFLLQILKHIDATLTASLPDQWLFPNDFYSFSLWFSSDVSYEAAGKMQRLT